MKMLISQEEFSSLKTTASIPFSCSRCNAKFSYRKTAVNQALQGKSRTLEYCSKNCYNESRKNGQEIPCTNCGSLFYKPLGNITTNNFCGKSCAAKYNNKNRKTGVRRSKAEIYLMELITSDFPTLCVQNSVRNLLPSGLEIDILIPDLNLAIELNGPVHYFPIYGKEKLDSIQNKDIKKQKELMDKGFQLIIVDVSQQKYWKTTKPFLHKHYIDYIMPIISNAL
jgi:hypothetical protein